MKQTKDGPRLIVERRYGGPADWLREQIDKLVGRVAERAPSNRAMAIRAEIEAKQAELAALHSVTVEEGQ
jgi:hypothetical protein